jgi:tetratricopeptide (TPR) repeat protein
MKLSRKNKKTRKKAELDVPANDLPLCESATEFSVEKIAVTSADQPPTLSASNDLQRPRKILSGTELQKNNIYSFGRYLRHYGLVFLLFPLLAFAIYASALDSNFVLDDYDNIETSQAVKMTELTWESLIRAGTEGFLQRRPLPNISFALNYYYGGLKTRNFRIFNILIHAINGLVLYLLFSFTFMTPALKRQNDTAGFIPLGAAIVWLVHPVQVQSVTYIVQRMNSMAAMFYLVMMLCYVKGRLTNSDRKRYIFFFLAVLSFLLGLGSKENVALAPFSLLLYEYIFFQHSDHLWLKKNLVKMSTFLLVSLAVPLIYLGGNPLSYIVSSYDKYTYTMPQRLMTESRVVVFYLKQILTAHPANLNILHWFSISESMTQPINTLLSVMLIAGLIFGAIYFSKSKPLFSFAVLWFFVNLLVESTFFNLEIVFEHRSYLPSTFVILGIVVYGTRITPPNSVRKVISLILIVVLCFWTYSRNSVWADEIAFWQDCIGKNPKANRAFNELANAYDREGLTERAVRTYYQGIAINNNDWRLHYNLADSLESKGETVKAIMHYERVIQIVPNFANAHYRLGINYARLEKLRKALWHSEEALRLDPSMQKAKANVIAIKKRLIRQPL